MTFTVLRIISFIVAIVGTTYLIPEAVALYCGETQLIPYFFVPMVVFWIIAAIFLLSAEKNPLPFPYDPVLLSSHFHGFL